MESFFTLNAEHKIGYKHLTKTDLGLKDTNNVTHIGLLNDVLTFLADKDVVKSAMLIYNDYCDILSCSFDRIRRNYGKNNSPKIKKGGREKDNIVNKIREFAKEKPNSDWLLVWFGLDSEEMVFWLIGDNTNDSLFANGLFPKKRGIINAKSPGFSVIVDYLTKKINLVSENLQMDLEVISQIGESVKPYKSRDVEKANLRFQQIGRTGEELVNNYLEKEKSIGNISSLNWVNKSKETGLPYDFIVNGRLYVDVKATSFTFNQHLVFSSQEIDFVTHKTEPSYAVFRVYDMNTDIKKLKICKKCLAYMKEINNPIMSLTSCIDAKQAIIKTVKIGIKPNICFREIQNPIVL